jgi:hypothetical protein
MAFKPELYCRFWEATLKPEDKPRPEDGRPLKEAFIKAKYCDRAYLLPPAGPDLSEV